MLRVMTVAVIVAGLMFSPVTEAGVDNKSGWYVAKIYGAKVKALINHSGEKVSGFAYYRDLFRKKHTFHFNGFYRNGRVRLWHYKGHVVEGGFTPGGRAFVGVLTTRKGQRVRIRAVKR